MKEKMLLSEYEKRYGPLPAHLRIEGRAVVGRECPLTNEATVELELPARPPCALGAVQ
jgi:hypothetical protein